MCKKHRDREILVLFLVRHKGQESLRSDVIKRRVNILGRRVGWVFYILFCLMKRGELYRKGISINFIGEKT